MTAIIVSSARFGILEAESGDNIFLQNRLLKFGLGIAGLFKESLELNNSQFPYLSYIFVQLFLFISFFPAIK